MKKILNFILTGVYILILMILSIFLFWEGYARPYLENYNEEFIKKEYGHDIKQTRNNSDFLIEMLGLKINNDES